MTAPRRRPARRGQGDRLRAELLAAADRLLLREGDADRVTVRAIAAEAGCAPGAMYMHFADRQDLLFAVCERHFAELDRWSARAAAGHDDPVEALAAMGKAYVDFGLAHPEAYRVLFMTSSAPMEFTDERVAPAAAFGRLVEAVQRCIDADRFAHDDAWLVATGLWAAVHGITSLLIAKPAFPWPPVEELVGHVLAVASRGLTT